MHEEFTQILPVVVPKVKHPAFNIDPPSGLAWAMRGAVLRGSGGCIQWSCGWDHLHADTVVASIDLLGEWVQFTGGISARVSSAGRWITAENVHQTGDVTVEFSNGDRPAELRLNDGRWDGTWNTSAQQALQVTLRETAENPEYTDPERARCDGGGTRCAASAAGGVGHNGVVSAESFVPLVLLAPRDDLGVWAKAIGRDEWGARESAAEAVGAGGGDDWGPGTPADVCK